MTTDITPQRPLAAIRDELCQEVEQAERDWQSAVRHAIRAGELLTEAKSQVKHGEWLPWLEANFPGSDRSARQYMRLARESARVADLPTIRDAVALLANPSSSEKSESAASESGEPPDAREARLKAQARLMVAKRHEGHDVNPRLFEAEVCIQAALLFRKEAAAAALELASMFATRRPAYAVACAEFAAVYLDEDSGPWDGREADVTERWQVATNALHAAIGSVS
jgi:hypothetical protein